MLTEEEKRQRHAEAQKRYRERQKESLDVLREEISKLTDRISLLEMENADLRETIASKNKIILSLQRKV